MNKTKFFSSLLVAALFATTSVFTSCKDYDDDIKNLQTQIDQKALTSELTALQSQLATISANATKAAQDAEAALKAANAAVTTAQLDAVKAIAEKAGTDAAAAMQAAATAGTDATNAADAAAAAAAAAQKAQETADKAVADAAAAATKELPADVQQAVKDIASLQQKAVTTDNLKQQLVDLGIKIEQGESQGEEVGKYKAMIDELYAAVTSVELYASYSWNHKTTSVSDQLYTYSYTYPSGYIEYYTGINPLWLNFIHGTVAEDSKFGDNEAYTAADKQIEYKKGADIKDATALIIRVNPVNADITSANIKLINSKGEDLDKVIAVTKAERFDELITRGASVNSGLWKLTLKAADGISEESFNKAVRVYDEATDTYGDQIAFAVAINNTAKNSEDRYVASTFDLTPWYGDYTPASNFTFSVNEESVNNVRNRWLNQGNGNYIVRAEHGETSTTNPELAWVDNTDKIPTPATAIVGKVGDDNTNVQIDNNKYYTETRRWRSFVYADVNEPFVLSNFTTYVGNKALDYYYVVFDKGNAIESAPSEWNAWNSYSVEGLGVMTPADQDLTMKITSASAKGDVVGFRVYAVNRDGTLADPDGRAFYVYVGKKGEENKEASAKIVATKTNVESEAMDVKGWFKAGSNYYFYPYDVNTANKNPKWIVDANNTQDFDMSNVTLKFYDKDGNLLTNGTYTDPYHIAGDDIKDAVKVTFTPNNNIAGMLNDATYTIFIRQSETHVDDTQRMPYATLTITKVMPDKAKTLEFRPKQETKDGTGDFIAYMIPNENAWAAPWATTFPTIDDAEATKAAYDATTARDNGFKNLNNIFYNLDEEDDIEFIFANSLKKDNKVVDLVDDNKTGIVANVPGDKYILDVAREFIDGTTKHNVQTYTNYDGVSTYYDKDNTLHYGEVWSVASTQKLTATYACWHHAMHDVAFKNAVSLQWSAEGTEAKTDYSNITTKNSYNSTYFGLTLDKLIANKWLIIAGAPELNTKADGSGQKNPYFVPTMDDANKKVVFTQASVQVDANPTANHDEYLIIRFKDAFGHTVALASKVTIKKATSNAPRH
jgi:hypothetical protein